MRSRASFTAILLALVFSSQAIPAAFAQEPYPYFRRSDEEVSVSSSIASSISSQPKVGVHLTADRSEANPGDDVRYWIKVVNLYDRDLPSWKIAFFFDPNQMQILESSGGWLEGDHLVFNVGASRSGLEQSFSVRVHLYRKLLPGETLRTYASMIWDGSISPACSKHDLHIIERPPVTGAGDATSAVENLGAYLRPISAAPRGSSMSLVVWVGILGLGLGFGTAVNGCLRKKLG